MSSKKEPPTELGKYVLELVQRLRRVSIMAAMYDAVATRQQIQSTPAEIQRIRDALQPQLDQTFRPIEEELLSGKEPLAVLKNFLGPL